VVLKRISISHTVYKLLIDAKRDEECFSDCIERLLMKNRADLSHYFGALKDNPILEELEEGSRIMRGMAKLR
jgi:predicted CopG family antitoxin